MQNAATQAAQGSGEHTKSRHPGSQTKWHSPEAPAKTDVEGDQHRVELDK